VSDSRQFAPLMRKRAKKLGKNGHKSGGDWRKMALFKGAQSAIFALPSRPRRIATLKPGFPYACRVPAASGGGRTANSPWSAIFHGLRHDLTYARALRFEDRIDFTTGVWPRALACGARGRAFSVLRWGPSRRPEEGPRGHPTPSALGDAGDGPGDRRKRLTAQTSVVLLHTICAVS
jgi:hypothetical protein